LTINSHEGLAWNIAPIQLVFTRVVIETQSKEKNGKVDIQKLAGHSSNHGFSDGDTMPPLGQIGSIC